jgi:hypothetical protein
MKKILKKIVDKIMSQILLFVIAILIAILPIINGITKIIPSLANIIIIIIGIIIFTGMMIYAFKENGQQTVPLAIDYNGENEMSEIDREKKEIAFDVENIDRGKLRVLLINHFSNEEIRGIWFDIGNRVDEIDRPDKTEMIRIILEKLEMQNKLHVFINHPVIKRRINEIKK